jgi:hypothetical protein
MRGGEEKGVKVKVEVRERIGQWMGVRCSSS